MTPDAAAQAALDRHEDQRDDDDAPEYAADDETERRADMRRDES